MLKNRTFKSSFLFNISFAIVVAILPKSPLYGQACSGSLGDNIFTDGDFGRGAQNIVQSDPGIAPGYTYTTNPPPNDGFYMITNDMARWSNVYGDWHKPKDNSNDPQGYMMVVNASYTPGIFYKQRITGLCENTRYVFSADILNLDRRPLINRIFPNVSFSINNEVKFSSGNITNDEAWHTYDFTFVTAANQTELDLSLINNAPGGVGNDLAIDNIAFRPCGPILNIFPQETANICEDGNPISIKAFINTVDGENYALIWQTSTDEGKTWTNLPGEINDQYLHSIKTPGAYWYRFITAGVAKDLANTKCRVISPIKIVNVQPKRYSFQDTICLGQAYLQAGKSYTQTGIYTDSLISVYGCDSIVTLQLKVIDDAVIDFNASGNAPSCDYITDGKITYEIQHVAYPPSIVSLSDSAGIELIGFEKLKPGLYTISVKDRFSCVENKTIRIEETMNFAIDLGPDINANLGDMLEIEASSIGAIAQVQWSGFDNLACNGNACPGITFTPLADGLLIAEAKNQNGCVDLDSISVHVGNPLLFTSNVMKNGGGENGSFVLKGNISSIADVLYFHVFDRWGNKVFDGDYDFKDDDGLGWSLTEIQKNRWVQGTYVYSMSLLLINGQTYSIRGDVTLTE